MSAELASTVPLAGAHIGYEYQDLVGAALLAVGLTQGLDSLATEIPRGGDTAFDDVEQHVDGRVVRWQVKHSLKPDHRLSADDLAERGKLSLRRMLTAASVEPATADEYRVLLTWSEPDEDELDGLLVAADDEVAAALPEWPTRRYRIDPDVVWPVGSEPAAFSGLDSEEARRSDLVELCRRTVFEFGALPMSSELLHPGPAEAWLLGFLTERVGLGRFPNEMAPEVAADRLVRLANHARPRAGAIGLPVVRQRLELKPAFGRLEQLSPIDPAHEVRRRRLAAGVLRTVAAQPVTVLTAGPGQGKTWAVAEIERLARRAGAVVARHYCYLRPDDTQLEERIRSDQMIAHLVADIVEQAPELAESGPTYAADLERLDGLLRKNAEAERPRQILLIVDGLDHVSRIRARARHLADAEVDLVERLSSLDLADDAHLLLLSQPGTHLAPIAGSEEATRLPQWEPNDLEILARRLGLDETAHPASPDAAIARARGLVVQHSAGSPLYCTYLSRSILTALEVDLDPDIEAVLGELPAAGGELGAYYSALLGQAAESVPGAREVALVLGIADFALTASDLREILGPVQSPTVERALVALRPLLVELGPESAYRIHHESFQRYIVDALQAEGVPLAAAIAPLVRWLEQRGFFSDARAFRHLFPSLLRSGQPRQVLEHVDAAFVASSLAHGHPYTATSANLAIAAQAAAEAQDFPAIVRCSELARAANSAYEHKLESVEQFAQAYVQAHGADAVADRLIFDGRPTWPRRPGLQLCLACDVAGGIPPWRHYLNLPRNVRANVYGDDQQEKEADRAGWLGVLRLADDPLGEAGRLLKEEAASVKDARAIVGHLAHVAGADVAETIVPRLVEGPPRMSGWLEVAGARRRAEDRLGAEAAARQALAQEGPARLLHRAIDAGADASLLADRVGGFEELVEQALHLASLTSIDGRTPIEEFTLRLRVHAANGADVAPVKQALPGAAWWHDWLRFCVDEAAGGIDGDRLAALRRLAVNAHPYAGKPRSIDLWQAQTEVAHTIDRLFSAMARTEWPDALPLLENLAKRTGTAYHLWSLLDLCERHLDEAPDLLAEFAIGQLHESLASSDDVYDSAASSTMRLADFYVRTGQTDLAARAWQDAAVYTAAYGYRKDITLFSLIESLEALREVDRAAALERATRLQPFASLVVDHTDGSETSHAPSEWLRQVIDIAPALAAQSLAWTGRWRGGAQNYHVEEGITRVLGAAAADGDPHLLEAIATTARGGLEARRLIVDRLLEADRDAGEEGALRLIAAADGDFPSVPAEASDLLAWARDHGIAADELSDVPATRSDRSSRAFPPSRRARRAKRYADPPLAAGHGVGALLRTIRGQRLGGEEREQEERFVLAFGLRLVELAQHGERATAGRLLRAFAQQRRLEENATSLVSLAEGLELHEEPTLAAHALVYSWIYGRHRWWQSTGGAAMSDRIARARELDPDATMLLAAELARFVRADPGQVGMADGIVGLLAVTGEPERAFAAWDAAAEVIFARLPALGDEEPTFAPIKDLDGDAGLNTSLAQLLAARLSHPRIDISREAIGGLLRVAQANSSALVEAIRFLLLADTSIIALEAALQVAVTSPHAREVGTVLAEELACLARAQPFLVRCQAAELLNAASLEVPARHAQTIALPELLLGNGESSQEVLALDWDERVERLEGFLPGISQTVATHFDKLWRGSDCAPEREGARWRLRTDNAHRVPPSRVRSWGVELFEVALQDHLGSVFGSERDDDLSAAHSLVFPRVQLLAGWTAGRTTRPGEQPHAGDPVAPLRTGRYPGWWRLAWLEDELVPGDGYGHEVREQRFAAGAIVFSQRPLSPRTAPLGVGRAADWWAAGYTAGQSPGHISPDRPFASVGSSDDPWGRRRLLMLPTPVASSLELHADRGGTPAMLDKAGREAVRFRRWWVRPFAEDGPAAWVPRIAGCELLVRDDVWEAINTLAIENPRWAHYETVSDVDFSEEN